MFSPNLTHGAPGRHVGADGSHVAPRGRLTEIAGSSRLLSPAATSDAQMGVSPPYFRFLCSSSQPRRRRPSIDMNTVTSPYLVPRLLINPSVRFCSRKVTSSSACISRRFRIRFCFPFSSLPMVEAVDFFVQISGGAAATEARSWLSPPTGDSRNLAPPCRIAVGERLELCSTI
jgi:hypothetical protein